jgi:ABC transporter substrate binding protein (PQQ-dependent alcohol dehydrogenase system)
MLPRSSRTMLCALALAVCPGLAAADLPVAVGYLELHPERPPTLTNLDPAPEDEGLAGARVGLSDNATTGGFLGHAYSLAETVVFPGEDWLAAAEKALAATPILVVNAPADALLALADLPAAEGALILNAGAEDVALREAECRANVLHTVPSYDMRSDALAQLLFHKRWTDWVMIQGTDPRDEAFAAALHGSAAKFGATIRAEMHWKYDSDMRRNAPQEVPLLTQDFPSHHVVVVVDEIDDFGSYILMNTWEPRPVVGSAGASPRAWSPKVEAFGAAQLQLRFERAADRKMRPIDYAAWAAVRAVGEAVTRTGSADPAEVRAFLLSDAFELAGFKGVPLSFRDWNGQLRQPMPVAHEAALVAMTPMDGFLHPTSTLDTLGTDRPESVCAAF